MIGKMMDTPLLVSDLIEHAASYHGDTAIISKEVDGSTTNTDWATVHSQSKKLAKAIDALGMDKGDRLATIAWSNHRHLEIWYAVSGSGRVCHTINPRLFPEQLIYIINDAKDRVLFYEKTFLPLIVGIKDHIPTVEHFVCMTPPDDEVKAKLPDTLFYDDLVEAQDDDYAWPVLDENDPSSLCYTSGTTGNPKGVMYTNRTTVIHTFAIALPDAMGISATDVLLPVVPMFHANAWGMPYVAALAGSSMVLPGPNLDGDSLVSIIDEYQVTMALGVPTIWQGLIAAAKAKGSKLASLNRNGIGGTACPSSMIRTFKEDYDCDTIHAWGMTETSPLGTINQLKSKHSKLSDDEKIELRLSQGRPAFGVKVRIVNGDNDNELLPNDGETPGNIQIKGYWIVDTYFGKPESALESDGWFDTGDIGTMDEDGYLVIRDRSKDLIKSGGEWISSVELEDIAFTHPAIAMAAAISADHEKWDERPVIIAKLKEGMQLSEDELIAHYEGKIAKWQTPDAVIFVDDIPLSGTGKIMKKDLRAQYKGVLKERGLAGA